MNRAVERVFGFFVLNAFENDRRFAHSSADEPFLSRECGRCSLANHPVLFAAVSLSPCEIVMIVNFFANGSAEQSGNLPAHPISSRVCVRTAQVHALDILI